MSHFLLVRSLDQGALLLQEQIMASNETTPDDDQNLLAKLYKREVIFISLELFCCIHTELLWLLSWNACSSDCLKSIEQLTGKKSGELITTESPIF